MAFIAPKSPELNRPNEGAVHLVQVFVALKEADALLQAPQDGQPTLEDIKRNNLYEWLGKVTRNETEPHIPHTTTGEYYAELTDEELGKAICNLASLAREIQNLQMTNGNRQQLSLLKEKYLELLSRLAEHHNTTTFLVRQGQLPNTDYTPSWRAGPPPDQSEIEIANSRATSMPNSRNKGTGVPASNTILALLLLTQQVQAPVSNVQSHTPENMADQIMAQLSALGISFDINNREDENDLPPSQQAERCPLEITLKEGSYAIFAVLPENPNEASAILQGSPFMPKPIQQYREGEEVPRLALPVNQLIIPNGGSVTFTTGGNTWIIGVNNFGGKPMRGVPAYEVSDDLAIRLLGGAYDPKQKYVITKMSGTEPNDTNKGPKIDYVIDAIGPEYTQEACPPLSRIDPDPIPPVPGIGLDPELFSVINELLTMEQKFSGREAPWEVPSSGNPVPIFTLNVPGNIYTGIEKLRRNIAHIGNNETIGHEDLKTLLQQIDNTITNANSANPLVAPNNPNNIDGLLVKPDVPIYVYGVINVRGKPYAVVSTQNTNKAGFPLMDSFLLPLDAIDSKYNESVHKLAQLATGNSQQPDIPRTLSTILGTTEDAVLKFFGATPYYEITQTEEDGPIKYTYTDPNNPKYDEYGTRMPYGESYLEVDEVSRGNRNTGLPFPNQIKTVGIRYRVYVWDPNTKGYIPTTVPDNPNGGTIGYKIVPDPFYIDYNRLGPRGLTEKMGKEILSELTELGILRK